MTTFSRPGTAFAFAILLVLGFLIYGNAIRHPFVHDDVVFILKNPDIARWDNLADVFFHPAIPFEGVRITTPYYRPFLELLYRLQFAVFGPHAWGFHLVNVFVHAINSWLVFILAGQLLTLKDTRHRTHDTGRTTYGGGERLVSGVRCLVSSSAFLIALLFLVHPVQNEAVACVSGISNLVVSFFILLSTVFYLRSRRIADTFFVLALAAFALALLSKELSAVLPLFLVALELTWFQKKGRLALARPGVFFVLLALYLVWRGHLFPDHFAAVAADPRETGLRLFAVPGIILMFLGLVIYPVNLHYYRSVDILSPSAWAWPVLALVFCVVFLLLRRLPRETSVPAALGIIWGGLFLLPGLNIIPLINEYSLVFAAEHFLYLSLAGFLLAIVCVARPFLSRATPIMGKTMGGVLCLLLVIFALSTVRMNTYWRGEIPLFERAVQFEPKLGRVRFLLARACFEGHRLPEAAAEYAQGLRIMEDYVKKSRLAQVSGAKGAGAATDVYREFLKTGYRDRAQVFLFMGDLKHSNTDYLASLAITFQGETPAGMRSLDSRSANNLAMNLLRMGDQAAARHWWQAAVKFDPGNTDALNNLGTLALLHNDRTVARFFFQAVLRRDSGNIKAAQQLKLIQGKGRQKAEF